MELSSTYRAIYRRAFEQGFALGFELGRIIEARRLVVLCGAASFGPPDRATRTAIDAMSDLGQLEELVIRLMNVASWQELVPTARRRNGRRTS